VRHHPVGTAAGRAGGAGLSRQLLRGRRLRPLGRRPPAHGGRMGNGRRGSAGRAFPGGRPLPPRGRGRRPAAPGVRRRVAVDGEPVRRLPRLPAPGRRPRRVQRQVHVQPDRPAGGFLRDAARPRPPDLSQLLPPGSPLAVLRPAPGEGPLMTTPSSRPSSPGTRPPATRRFRADVLRGLRLPQKQLPCKYFYDEAGSQLFERITELDEYYLTRVERAILERHAADMADLLGHRCLLVEYGSGNGSKTRLLLDRLRDPAGYVPIDVSAEPLRHSAAALAAD